MTWYKEGQFHREDGPAVIEALGTKRWYINGKLHRDGGPAIEASTAPGFNGKKIWYQHGKEHREDGPAEISPDGSYCWYINGKIHNPNPNEPALYLKGKHIGWAFNGEFHRLDGPAVIYENGKEEWWINGKNLSEKEIAALKLNKELSVELSETGVINQKKIKL
jgi:hypothetical protein